MTKLSIVSAILLAICNASAAVACKAAGAELFLRSVYAPYIAGNTEVAPTGDTAPRIFDTRLTRLIRRDQAQGPGEIGKLDQDPICDCQDFDRLKLRSVGLRCLGSNQATANVRFANGNTKVALTYTLTESGRGWRISDIRSKVMPSLVDFLQAATQR